MSYLSTRSGLAGLPLRQKAALREPPLRQPSSVHGHLTVSPEEPLQALSLLAGPIGTAKGHRSHRQYQNAACILFVFNKFAEAGSCRGGYAKRT